MIRWHDLVAPYTHGQFTEYGIIKPQNNSQSRNYEPCDKLQVFEAYFSIFFFKFLSKLLVFNNFSCLWEKFGKGEIVGSN